MFDSCRKIFFLHSRFSQLDEISKIQEKVQTYINFTQTIFLCSEIRDKEPIGTDSSSINYIKI